MNDRNWTELKDFLAGHRDRLIVAPPLAFFRELGCKPYETLAQDRSFDLLVIHKPVMYWLPLELLQELVDHGGLVFENNISYVIGHKSLGEAALSKRKLIRRLEQFEQEPIAEQKLVFVHVPKTAGRSVYQNLRKQFRRQIYLRPNYSQDDDVCLQQLNFIAGHLSVFDFCRKLRGAGCLWLTVLRHPLERLLSLIAHTRRDPTAHYFEQLTSCDVRELVESERWKKMCVKSIQMLSGLPPGAITEEVVRQELIAAREFLLREDVVFGVQDELEEFYDYVQKRTGIQCNSTMRKNVTTDYSVINDDERRFLEEYTSDLFKLELELYLAARDAVHIRTASGQR